MPTNDSASYAAVILAGGQGTRMHNQDKGLVQYHQQSLVSIVLSRLQTQLSNILIVANRNLAQYQALGCPVISDWPQPQQTPTYDGPLRGICRAMEYFQTHSPLAQWLLLAPCDAPNYPTDLLHTYQKILAHSEAHYDCLLPHDSNRMQPLFALLRLSCRPQLELALSKSELSLRRVLPQLNCCDIALPQEYFVNINRPEQLHA